MADAYLLDTSALSLAAPGRPPLPSEVVARLQGRDAPIFMCSITIVEIQQGVEKLRRAGGVARADRLERWLLETIDQFGDRLLTFDKNCARAAGQIADAAVAEGVHPGFPDVAIAATARAHDLTVLTRNLKHFVPLGVACLDPFKLG